METQNTEQNLILSERKAESIAYLRITKEKGKLTMFWQFKGINGEVIRHGKADFEQIIKDITRIKTAFLIKEMA